MAYYCKVLQPLHCMKPFATYGVILIVIALFAQSVSLALNQEVRPRIYNKLGSKIAYKAEKSYDIFSVTSAPVHKAAAFAQFWLHGFRSAVEPFREKPPKSAHPISRRTWVSSPYYRAGLDFNNWGRKRAAWEAHRYDRYLKLEFLSKIHPAYALAGYWAGRLFFLTVAVALSLLLAAAMLVNKVLLYKIPNLKGARIQS